MRGGQRVAPGWRSDDTGWRSRSGVRPGPPDYRRGGFQAGFRIRGSQKRRILLGASYRERSGTPEAGHGCLRANGRLQCFQEPDQALDPGIFPIATTGLGGMGLGDPGAARSSDNSGECGKSRSGPPAVIGPAIARAVIGTIRGYRLFVSPLLAPSCRFHPSCSIYAIEAVQRHGAAKGSRLALERICRCHPWNAGGHDPVP